MRKIAAALLSLALLAPAHAAQPARKAAPVAARDWSTVVLRAPSGAYVMGNPKAKVKLVEYASLTCSHCAAFAGERLPALRADYVRKGLVSIELRHAVRDRADMAASLIARCAGPRGYFPAIEKLFAKQDQWLPRAAAAVPDEPGAPDTPAAREKALVDTANGAGLPAIAGLSPAAAAVCLRSPVEQKALGAMAEEAWGTRRIPGTPSFLINDQAVEGSSWAMLEPKLTAALR